MLKVDMSACSAINTKHNSLFLIRTSYGNPQPLLPLILGPALARPRSLTQRRLRLLLDIWWLVGLEVPLHHPFIFIGRRPNRTPGYVNRGNYKSRTPVYLNRSPD